MYNPLQTEHSILELEAILGHGRYLLFLHGSFGDVYPNLALLRPFLKEHSGEVRVLIDSRYEAVSHRYSAERLEFFYISSDDALKRSLLGSRGFFTFKRGSIFSTLPTLQQSWAELSLSYSVTDLILKRILLRLHPATPFEWAPLDRALMHKSDDYLNKKGLLKGESVLLAPFTNSNTSLDVQEVAFFCERIREVTGRRVALNCSGVKPGIVDFFRGRGEICIDIPPETLPERIGFFGYVISALSGFCMPLLMQQNSCKVLIYWLSNNVNGNMGAHNLPSVREQYGQDICTSLRWSEHIIKRDSLVSDMDSLIDEL